LQIGKSLNKGFTNKNDFHRQKNLRLFGTGSFDSETVGHFQTVGMKAKIAEAKLFAVWAMFRIGHKAVAQIRHPAAQHGAMGVVWDDPRACHTQTIIWNRRFGHKLPLSSNIRPAPPLSNAPPADARRRRCWSR